jgi:hypothetical protein
MRDDQRRFDLLVEEIKSTIILMLDDDGKKINVKQIKLDLKALDDRVKDLEKVKAVKEVKEI